MLAIYLGDLVIYLVCMERYMGCIYLPTTPMYIQVVHPTPHTPGPPNHDVGILYKVQNPSQEGSSCVLTGQSAQCSAPPSPPRQGPLLTDPTPMTAGDIFQDPRLDQTSLQASWCPQGPGGRRPHRPGLPSSLPGRIPARSRASLFPCTLMIKILLSQPQRLLSFFLSFFL